MSDDDARAAIDRMTRVIQADEITIERASGPPRHEDTVLALFKRRRGNAELRVGVLANGYVYAEVTDGRNVHRLEGPEPKSAAALLWIAAVFSGDVGPG